MKKNITLWVNGMTCTGCENAIHNALRKIDGVSDIRVSFIKGVVQFKSDNGDEVIPAVKEAIVKLGYEVTSEDQKRAEAENENSMGKSSIEKSSMEKNQKAIQYVGIGVILLALFVIIKNTVGFDRIPEIPKNAGYIALFFIGLITSLHCVAMCGGINISQCMKYTESKDKKGNTLMPSFLYNSGRVLSYTLIGGLAGALGASISFSGRAKGIVAVIAGIFMILMGLNLLGDFPLIRKIVPRIPGSLRAKSAASTGKSPFIVGLLNGLMPCGPLQAMQIYALGTGSFFTGAMSMFFFSLGTVPLMMGLGALTTYLGSRFSRNMMRVGAVLVIFLGLVMSVRGFALSGFMPSGSLPKGTVTAAQIENGAVIENGVQTITTDLGSQGYPVITVEKGVHVKWNLKAEEGSITGCNRALTIPAYGVEKELKVGDNIIEFTPDKTGTIPYSCWMGMIRSKIVVVDHLNGASNTTDTVNTTETDITNPTLNNSAVIPSVGSGCCGSGGNGGSGGVGGGGCCGSAPIPNN